MDIIRIGKAVFAAIGVMGAYGVMFHSMAQPPLAEGDAATVTAADYPHLTVTQTLYLMRITLADYQKHRLAHLSELPAACADAAGYNALAEHANAEEIAHAGLPASLPATSPVESLPKPVFPTSSHLRGHCRIPVETSRS